MPSRSGRTAGGLCLLVALVVACLALFASVAFAAPSESIMSLAELQTKLADSPTGTLQGHLKTVWRGAAIEDVPVEVQAVTLGSQTGPESMGSLILFEASGPQITKYGGIVAGMSGSPIYVDDEGEDKLVGALSYGDIFTIGGTGLATPIEGMAQLETDYAQPLLAPLSKPVMTEDGLVTRVLVTPDPSGIDPKQMEGTFVAKPLATVFLGGISQNSNAFKRFGEALKTKGYSLVPMGAPSNAAEASFSTDFDPGSSVAALATKGDLWVGGIGTTTYSNDDNVVMFGHPLFWEGDTSLYLANAWIDGVWPSQLQPYKLGGVGAIRGTITQDRGAGVLGTTDEVPTETHVTGSATNSDTGKSAAAVVDVSQHVMGSARWDYLRIPSLSAYVAGARVLDLYSPQGSAQTTTTIVVSDGTDTYTIERPNVFDNSYDLGLAITNDVTTLVSQLRGINNNGVGRADIISVDLQSTVTKGHNKAQIVDVKTPNGLKIGQNKVVVSLRQYGVVATQSVDVTLTIPAGTSLSGRLSATCVDQYGDGTMSSADDMSGMENWGTINRTTLADAIGDLRSAPANDDLIVRYVTADAIPIDQDSEEPEPPAAAEVSTKVPWYLIGYSSKSTSSIAVELSASTIPYNGMLFVGGAVDGAESGNVQIYRRYTDETAEVLVATAPIESFEGDTFFEALITGSKKNFQLRLHYDGDSQTLASEAKVTIKVAAKVTLSASPTSAKYGAYVTLKAAVLPTTATGSVAFEKLVRGRWVRIATKSVAAGSASYKFKPGRGTISYRSRYLGGPTNAAGTSNTKKVVIR